MKKEDYKFYQTFFDAELLRSIVVHLKSEGIMYKIIDKSNQTNFKVPMSTFIEIDLYLKDKDFEKVDEILKKLLT